MNRNENLWFGKFGNDYHARNPQSDRLPYWLDVFDLTEDEILGDNQSVVRSICEVGAGQGDNLAALQQIFKARLAVGIEINSEACGKMAQRGFTAINSPFLQVENIGQFELVVTRGFLMHVPDEQIGATLRKIYDMSKRYIVLGEYYSPVRREVKYHGQDSALWIDDFAGKMMELFPDLRLMRYVFHYDRDNKGDDITYFWLTKE